VCTPLKLEPVGRREGGKRRAGGRQAVCCLWCILIGEGRRVKQVSE